MLAENQHAFNTHCMGIGKFIASARRRRGWKYKDLAERSGVDTGTLNALEKRDSSRSEFFPAIAAALGLTMEQMAAGEDIALPELAQVSNEARAPLPAGLAPILSWQHPDDLPPSEYVMIPRMNVHLSAGGGRDQCDVELVKATPQAFRADWIRRKRLKPAVLACMYASGDSMNPRIYDGDSLVVDTSQTTVQDGGVYALWYDGGERVKRLFRKPGGGLIIRSDNSAQHPDMILTAEESEHVRVIGRVVHVQGDGGL